MAIALHGPSKWLITKMRARQRFAVSVRSSTGTNQSIIAISRSLRSFNMCLSSRDRLSLGDGLGNAGLVGNPGAIARVFVLDEIDRGPQPGGELLDVFGRVRGHHLQ